MCLKESNIFQVKLFNELGIMGDIEKIQKVASIVGKYKHLSEKECKEKVLDELYN